MSDKKQMGCYYASGITPAEAARQAEAASSFAAPTGLAAPLNRERLTKIENRLGWGGSDKWPVAQSIGLWAVAAETLLDERDALRAKLEMITRICKSTKHLDPIADILKECEAANEKVQA